MLPDSSHTGHNLWMLHKVNDGNMHCCRWGSLKQPWATNSCVCCCWWLYLLWWLQEAQCAAAKVCQEGQALTEAVETKTFARVTKAKTQVPFNGVLATYYALPSWHVPYACPAFMAVLRTRLCSERHMTRCALPCAARACTASVFMASAQS